MGGKGKNLSKESFMTYFGRLQKFLQNDVPKDNCYFLTDVEITELHASAEVLVAFTVEYGPVAYYTGSFDDVNASMLNAKFGFVFSKDGIYKRCIGKEPSYSMSFKPAYVGIPSFDDFPYEDSVNGEEETLFDVIKDIIKKLGSSKAPLHSVQFCTVAPDWDYEFIKGIPAREDDGGEPSEFVSRVRGLSLVRDFTDDVQFCYQLNPSKEVSGEYELVFWVVNQKANYCDIVYEEVY